MGKIETIRAAMAGRPAPQAAAGARSVSSPARQKLAEAIARHQEALEAIGDNERALERLRGKWAEAEARVEAAQERLAGARVLRRERLIDEDLPAPAVSVKEAAAALEKAEEALSVLQEAMADARVGRARELKRQAEWQKGVVESAVKAVLIEDADAVQRLVDETREARRRWADLLQTSAFLESAGAKIPFGLWAQPDRVVGPLERSWINAVEALKSDADTAMPEV
ncbi:MAG: hypothetical protein ACREDP_22590 [Bradyrhizobium sp.]